MSRRLSGPFDVPGMTPVSFHINRQTSSTRGASLEEELGDEARREEDDFLGIMQIAFLEARASVSDATVPTHGNTMGVDAILEHAEFSSPDVIVCVCARAPSLRKGSMNADSRKFRERLADTRARSRIGIDFSFDPSGLSAINATTDNAIIVIVATACVVARSQRRIQIRESGPTSVS